ncbi:MULTISPECIES: putative nitrogen fixation protein NifT [Corallincola]|uniref:Nitrogen fixation protein NifT n=3 Tax=Corallincola TaxID=1775176 RepID=A0ABY1WU86_9GAMM|nr:MULTISPECIES: putative nitrogen fixation protein NifT [Corallincola]RCU52503.1 putative nitrogen fixation protein NifT [Corallincola holothuriorum]TAA48305.1 putative nitrogen fixation protein NifT [Corallincola spongiicola]TCI02390.1 putative nitrogen fixation protein NifT [Corallincola luteus]
MPNVMIRREESGELSCYIAKKDLEEMVTSIEFDSPEQLGGEIQLADGTGYYFEPISPSPKLPVTVRARRA